MPGMNMFPGGTTLQIPLDAPAGFTAKAGNAQVTLTWTDPKDKYATPEGETAQDPDQLVSVWDHTVLVRKTGSQPAGPNDGTVVVSSSVRDQYASAGYVDTGLQNDTTYYYGVFAYNVDGVTSPGAFASATPTAGTPLGTLAEGTLIKILENGSPVEFYLAKHSYEPGLNGQGRELVVRSSFAGRGMWQNASTNYTYSGHEIDQWCQSYVNRFSQTVKSLISTTKFYEQRAEWASQVNQLERPAFPLSINELNLATSSGTSEGSPLPIASTLLAGAMRDCWTRSIYTFAGNYSVYFINNSGNRDEYRGDQIKGYLPAFTLPSTARVDAGLNLIEE